jgi:hypothetical protein
MLPTGAMGGFLAWQHLLFWFPLWVVLHPGNSDTYEMGHRVPSAGEESQLAMI